MNDTSMIEQFTGVMRNYDVVKRSARSIDQSVERSEIVELYTGNLGEREIVKNCILSEGARGPTIYAAQQEHIQSGKKSKVTIWKTREMG